jgi:hypothetical protein
MHKAVGSKSILGGGLKNKFELLLHFSSSFVCVCLYKWNMGGGGLMPRPPLLTTLICDLISTWLGPTHLCFFPKEINKEQYAKRG